MGGMNGRRHKPGTAAYANGQETVVRILDAAFDIVIDEGMAGLSMRRVARALGISPGNLSYYYAAKADLIEDLLTRVIDGYLREFERLRDVQAEDPEAQLRAVITYVFDDLQSRSTTCFFPELWVLANRDAWAAQQMERIYSVYRSVLEDIIALMRPKLSAADRSDLALAISACIEGHTMFVGHDRPHRARHARLRELVVTQSVMMVRSAPSTKELVRGKNGP